MRPDDLRLTPAQRRKESLRTSIIRAATDLYQENGGPDGGFEATTIEGIAERADISVRTFFRYFESKVDVIYLDKRRAIDDLSALTEQQLDSGVTPTSALVGASIAQVQWFLNDPLNRDRLRRSLLAPQFSERLAIWRDQERRELSEIVGRSLDSGGTASEARIITTIVRDLFHSALDDWAVTDAASVREIVSASLEAIPVIAADVARALVDTTNTKGRRDRTRKTTGMSGQ